MNARRVIPALLVAAALAPPAALADSAGDQQYTDPLATTTAPTPHPADTNSTATAPAETPTPAPSSSAPVASSAAATPSGTTTTTAASDPAGGKRLPYTGINLPLLASCGGLLLLAGFGLRRLVRWA